MAPEPQAQRWSRIRAERREQILAGAARTFARHGVAKSSMELVAAESDATKVTVYTYFRSKDRLVAAVLQRWLASVMEAVDSVSVDATCLQDVLWGVAEGLERTVNSEAYVSLSRAIDRAEGVPGTVVHQWARRFDSQRVLLTKTFLALGSPDAREQAHIFLSLLERQAPIGGAGAIVRLFLAAYRKNE